MSQLPFLPGYRVEVNPKQQYHKSHIFDVHSGVRVSQDRQGVDVKGLTATHNLSVGPLARDYKDAVDSKTSTPESVMSKLPAWVAYDRKVLRFFGYFKEAVHASSQENWRVRKCVLYYYLEDDSLHIAEPKVENSGIPQGVFVKRHRVPKPSSNEYVGVTDLFIGAELPIYGRVFRLVDCDQFSREFYQANGVDLGQVESYPLDAFTKKHTVRPTTHHKLMNPLKEYMEASLGKPMHAGVEATQKFLINDGKVLRFYCVWDDSKMYGEKRPYILHYFLADETVEVLEIQQANSGRDVFPALLKRQRLPKNFVESAVDISSIGVGLTEDHKARYYHERDFRVGDLVDVYGRNLLICGTDKFTENYYIQKYQMTPDDFPRINMEDNEVEVSKIVPPPHNGFGSEEDSLGSFLYLMPKVPKQDFKKLMENDGINLRFMAKLINPTKVDKDRRFIITFYLNNDTLGVFEKFDRNSGFIGGKFLERGRVKNPSTNEYFKAIDFFVGAVLNVNHFVFELIECDEYTRKFMSNNNHIWKTGLNANQTNKESYFAAERSPLEESPLLSTQEIASYRQ